MKKFTITLLLAIFTLSISYAQTTTEAGKPDCNLEENVDEFSGRKSITTKIERIGSSYRGKLSLSVYKTEDDVKIMVIFRAEEEVVCFIEDSEIQIKLENGEVLELKSGSTDIECDFRVIFITKGLKKKEIKKLLESPISNIRLRGDFYTTIEVEKPNYLMDNLKCIME